MWVIALAAIAIFFLASPAAASQVTSSLSGLLGSSGGVMASLQTQLFGQAVATQEGYGIPGARPTRNNNPGDLRPPNGSPNFWSGQVGVDGGGFAIFATPTDGWNALFTNLETHFLANPEQTIAQYIAEYAPASDGNNPTSYAQAVAGALGVSPDTTLGELA